MADTAKPRVFAMTFASIYPLYVNKVARKARTQAELDQVIEWLTGYDDAGLRAQIESGVDLETFFTQAPHYSDQAGLITGLICGVRVEEIADPTMKKVRQMDKLVDELAKGKAMEKILRT